MANITRKGNPIHTVGELPKVGSPGPNLRLTRGELSDISLADFEGKVEDPQHRPPSIPASGRPRRALEQVPAGREYRGPPRKRAVLIAYRISVLEQREGLNLDRPPPIGSPTPRPLQLGPVGRGNKLLDSRYFFPSQGEGIEGGRSKIVASPCQGIPKPKRDGYIAILTPGHPC